MRIIITLILAAFLVQTEGVIYPPEGQPLQPFVQVLWMILPAPDIINPVLDPSQLVDKMIMVTFADYPTQALADAACTSVIANDNQTLANDPANISRDRLAGCVRVDYTATGDGGNALAWVASGAGHAQAEFYRAQYGADLVQFITHDTNICGQAYQDSWRYGKAYGYSMVSKSCIINNFSNIHEEGHNRGAGHDAPNQSGQFYAWAKGFCDSAHSRRDVMTYPSPCGGSRGPYFSNPNISPYGSPFGDAAVADNARVIRDTAAAIAGFMSSPSTTIVNYPR